MRNHPTETSRRDGRHERPGSDTIPVLLVGFNRPDLMAGAIDALRDIRPQRLYVAVDGPRPDVGSDLEAVRRTQAAIERIDWTCDLRTRFRDRNCGCAGGVTDAISWAFETEECLIILEDDIRPHPDFFSFAADLLHRYADDERVATVCGSSFIPPERTDGRYSYRFSSRSHPWGWATWKRTWDEYAYERSHNVREYTPWSLYERLDRSLRATAYWTVHFEAARRGLIDTWDYPFGAFQLRHGYLSAFPNVNVIDNIGFRDDATHSERPPDYLQPVGSLALPLRHPPVTADTDLDRLTQRTVYRFPVRRTIQRAVHVFPVSR